MTFWDFLWKCLEQHPRFFFTGAVAVLILAFQIVLSGIPITINRNVFPVRWTDKFPSKCEDEQCPKS